MEGQIQWIADRMAHYLSSPSWSTPIQSFVDQHCQTFIGDQQNTHAHMSIFQRFKEMVDTMLQNFIAQLGITQQQFIFAFQVGLQKSSQSPIFRKLLSCSDFVRFKMLMVHRNKELQLASAALLYQQGHMDTIDLRKIQSQREEAQINHAIQMSLAFQDRQKRNQERQLREMEEAIRRNWEDNRLSQLEKERLVELQRLEEMRRIFQEQQRAEQQALLIMKQNREAEEKKIQQELQQIRRQSLYLQEQLAKPRQQSFQSPQVNFQSQKLQSFDNQETRLEPEGQTLDISIMGGVEKGQNFSTHKNIQSGSPAKAGQEINPHFSDPLLQEQRRLQSAQGIRQIELQKQKISMSDPIGRIEQGAKARQEQEARMALQREAIAKQKKQARRKKIQDKKLAEREKHIQELEASRKQTLEKQVKAQEEINQRKRKELQEIQREEQRVIQFGKKMEEERLKNQELNRQLQAVAEEEKRRKMIQERKKEEQAALANIRAQQNRINRQIQEVRKRNLQQEKKAETQRALKEKQTAKLEAQKMQKQISIQRRKKARREKKQLQLKRKQEQSNKKLQEQEKKAKKQQEQAQQQEKKLEQEAFRIKLLEREKQEKIIRDLQAKKLLQNQIHQYPFQNIDDPTQIHAKTPLDWGLPRVQLRKDKLNNVFSMEIQEELQQLIDLADPPIQRHYSQQYEGQCFSDRQKRLLIQRDLTKAAMESDRQKLHQIHLQHGGFDLTKKKLGSLPPIQNSEEVAKKKKLIDSMVDLQLKV